MKQTISLDTKKKEIDASRGKRGFDFPEEGGILTYLVGEKYPVKGFPDKKEMFVGSLDQMKPIKRVILCSLRFVSNNRWLVLFVPVLLIKPLRARIVWSLLAEIADISEVQLRDFCPNPKFYCRAVRELYLVFGRWNEKFCGHPTAYWFKARDPYNNKGRIVFRIITFFCMFFQFDDYFRYIIQDLFGEMDKKALLDNPLRELLRIANLGRDRDKMVSNRPKWNSLIRFIRLGSILFNKEIKEFAKILADCDFEKIKLDEGDWYACLIRKNYDFKGISFEQRFLIRKQIDEQI